MRLAVGSPNLTGQMASPAGAKGKLRLPTVLEPGAVTSKTKPSFAIEIAENEKLR
jgi:hypothetical protein